ncbi:hypothetical protein BVC80_1701g28 [Macleaya cordata]|uniref:DUF7950 domain-containing protein n=1 Tax=Macleaya cordata TaxID=56857 RepID=A0A200Q5X7_MACCD|nr:hypothetical protein BVC80_1701g28 [Macleaya cordata]
MMLNTINPHTSSKLDQIMSRYRPIAPKPQIPPSILEGPTTTESTFSRNQLPSLQQTKKARKRGRYGISSAATRKRARTLLHASSSSYGVASLTKNTQQLGLSMNSYSHAYPPQFSVPNPLLSGSLEKPMLNLVRFPFLPYTSSPVSVPSPAPELHATNQFKDFNNSPTTETPKEMDLLQNLHAALVMGSPHSGSRNLIAPQPVRPVGSSISVGCISEDSSSNSTAWVSKKKPEEVEAEAESDALPVVVSDSNNKVRLANSAFKEMVGQPECPWLDSMATNNEQLRRGNACKRIGGEVMLDLSNSRVPISSNGFSCRVRIEWGTNGQKSSISAPCNVMKLFCESKDYLFTWRIHTREASESNFCA